ncbi:MAG: hypothetical protein IT558_06065 [Alphaproteobacteria bacterium]|nr:hypothetical protein [Alphaproteobacteria bacterium]
MRILGKIAGISVLCLAGAQPASAEIFYWQDPETKLSVTFPDTWLRVSNQQPEDLWTVAAPGANDYATCRLRVDEDRRFVIYPREYADSIQRLNYSRKFWDDYVGQFNGAVINAVHDNAGLGQGFASWADVSFISSSGASVQKRGIMFASVYNDKAFVLECSAEASVYEKWMRPFLSVVKSVDFRTEYSTRLNGYYRPFQYDGRIKIHNRRDIDLYVY